MPNTFDAVPDAQQERSQAFLSVDRPQERLEKIMEEAQLHRGSLREQDGYTIPFREGGSVRIRIVQGQGADGEAEGEEGLNFLVVAPTAERREHIQTVIAEQTAGQLTGEPAELDWTTATLS
ncbi:hypothetical protein ACQBAT_07905 [Ornithinimicrobium sp. Y1847]|uniref:hypothetical protein n=1 Tax=unclassified Ornithinimicrobium TaxID=2615080 RepID=UPI003B677B64